MNKVFSGLCLATILTSFVVLAADLPATGTTAEPMAGGGPTEGSIIQGSVSFENLKDGDTVKSPVTVKMKVTGLTIRKVGEGPIDLKTGHHHLIIDGGPMKAGTIIPVDATHLHFGKGQTEASVVLTPGPHTITMQFADGAHRSYGAKMSATVKIIVK